MSHVNRRSGFYDDLAMATPQTHTAVSAEDSRVFCSAFVRAPLSQES